MQAKHHERYRLGDSDYFYDYCALQTMRLARRTGEGICRAGKKVQRSEQNYLLALSERACGAPLPRCRTCQGRRPLPAVEPAQCTSDSRRVIIELIREPPDIDRKFLKNDELIMLISVLAYY